MKIENLIPILPREGVKRVRVWYGPYELGAANVGITAELRINCMD
jgi:hypothetical protein